MTLDIIKKAANAMIKKKKVSCYRLPEKLEKQILARHYSVSEINGAYTRANRANNAR